MTAKRKEAVPPHKVPAKREAASSNQQTNSNASCSNPQDLQCRQQELMLLSLLQTKKHADTFFLRSLGINHPAGRVQSLRQRGYNIETRWTRGISQTGKSTRIALYVLQPSPQKTIFDVLNEGRGGLNAE